MRGAPKCVLGGTRLMTAWCTQTTGNVYGRDACQREDAELGASAGPRMASRAGSEKRGRLAFARPAEARAAASASSCRGRAVPGLTPAPRGAGSRGSSAGGAMQGGHVGRKVSNMSPANKEARVVSKACSSSAASCTSLRLRSSSGPGFPAAVKAIRQAGRSQALGSLGVSGKQALPATCREWSPRHLCPPPRPPTR